MNAPVVAPGAVLGDGLWMFLYPTQGWAQLEPARIAADLRALGVRGVIPQSELSAPAWLKPARMQAFADAGLEVAIGLGSLGPRRWQQLADATCAALDVPGACGVLPDCEGSWDNAEREAALYVDDVIKRRPSASLRVVDVPWYAPKHAMDGRSTHPHYPTQTFGRLASLQRAPQVYGAIHEGLTATMLAFARAEYAKLGAWSIVPCVQLYHRSVRDHLQILLSERVVLGWDYTEMDATARVALLVAVALAQHGYRGPGAVRAFQASAGATVDGLVGPATARALGVQVPEGIAWTHPA